MHPPREPPAFFNCEEERGEGSKIHEASRESRQRTAEAKFNVEKFMAVVAGGGLRRRRRVEIAFIPGFIARDLSYLANCRIKRGTGYERLK